MVKFRDYLINAVEVLFIVLLIVFFIYFFSTNKHNKSWPMCFTE